MPENSRVVSPLETTPLPQGHIRLLARELKNDAPFVRRLITAANRDVAVGTSLKEHFGIELPQARLPAVFIFLVFDRQRGAYQLLYTEDMQVCVILSGRRYATPELRDASLAAIFAGVRTVILTPRVMGYILLSHVMIYFDIDCLPVENRPWDSQEGAAQLRIEDEILKNNAPK